ncbi:MAG: hypothetical protein IKW85_06585 [Muribaculaceae bacterium]|nr:hypothetical protein [Muribaculaceae bacterium]
MRKYLFALSAVIAAFMAPAGIHATTVPTDMYVEPGTHSCVVTWNDDDNSAWNLRYRLYSEEPAEPVLLHSLSGTAYSGSYADITLSAPWGGVNTRAGNGAIYIKNNYNGVATGYITYTIPEGYINATFTLMIKTVSGNYGVGNVTAYTPQTASVGHDFSGGETYRWLVTASSGEKITIYSTDTSYSPDMALIAVYSGNATGAKAADWTYVNNLTKTEYTIEGLELGTEYEVQVQAIGDDGTLSDWCRSDVFMTLDEEPFVTPVHILGDIDDQAWAPDAGTKMEYDPETELYTATIHVEDGRTFGFSTELDVDDQGGWNYLLPYRFGPESDGVLTLTDENLGKQLTLTFDNWGDVRALIEGDYEVTVSLEQNYIIICKIEPEYQKGDVNKDGFVNITDAIDLIGIILNQNTFEETDHFSPTAADMNNDGFITITDAINLIDYLISTVNP